MIRSRSRVHQPYVPGRAPVLQGAWPYSIYYRRSQSSQCKRCSRTVTPMGRARCSEMIFNNMQAGTVISARTGKIGIRNNPQWKTSTMESVKDTFTREVPNTCAEEAPALDGDGHTSIEVVAFPSYSCAPRSSRILSRRSIRGHSERAVLGTRRQRG